MSYVVDLLAREFDLVMGFLAVAGLGHAQWALMGWMASRGWIRDRDPSFGPLQFPWGMWRALLAAWAVFAVVP